MGEEYHRLALQKQHQTFLRVDKHLKQARARQKRHHDKRAVGEEFAVGDAVFLHNPARKHKLDKRWLPYYRIMEQTGPVNFIIRSQIDGTVRKVHSTHLRKANLEWIVPPADTQGRPPRKTRLAADPDSGGSLSDISRSEESDGSNESEREVREGSGGSAEIPTISRTTPTGSLNTPANNTNNQPLGGQRVESSDGYMEWDPEDEIPLAHLPDRKRGPRTQKLKRARDSDPSDSETDNRPATRSKHRRVNRIKQGDRGRNNKRNVKNLLEAIAALV